MIKRLYANRRSVFKASSRAMILTTGLIIQRFFSIAISIYVARILGTEVFGEFTLFVTLFVIFSEIPRAIDNTYIRFANACSSSLTTDVAAHLAINVLLKVLYAVLLITLVNLYAVQLANIVVNKPESLKVIVAGVSIGTLYGVFISLPAFFQRCQRFSRVAALRPIYHGLVVLVGILLIETHQPINLERIIDVHFQVAVVLATGAVLFLLWHSTWRSFFDFKLIKAHMCIASILAFAMLVSLCAARLDIFIIGRLLSFEDLGMYGAAVRTAMIASIFTGAIATIMLPKAAQATETQSAYQHYMRLARFYIMMQIVIAVVIVIFCQPILALLFGVVYEGGAQITALLVIQTVLTACAVPYRALIQCSTKPGVLVVIALIALCLNGILMYRVIPIYGLFGVASCMVVTALIVLFMVIFASKRLTNRYFLRATRLTVGH